ncbi:MAG: type II toxin-antitoxin system VapC family toxin [Colwellia sp.]|nr:type II toxin-antitoxin system VapC family toxin [Colwellia sp.]
MIGLDTNVLARYYIDDESDAEATKQHLLAKKLIESGKPLFVSKTVMLELEWVMRGYYRFKTLEISLVFKNLLSHVHISIEDDAVVKQAIISFDKGLDFADALHLSSSKHCTEFSSFDDKKFAKRAKRYGLLPVVKVPKNKGVGDKSKP